MMSRWPAPGRCGACLQPAEQYPSGRWRHTTRPCPGRSGWLQRVDTLPLPPVEFVADGDPLPQPGPRWPTTVHYEDGVPTSMGFHPPEQVAEFWASVRAALAERSLKYDEHEETA